MSRFNKLSHTIWDCYYHAVWAPENRFRVLYGLINQEVKNCIRAFSEQKHCEVVEQNIQIDHIQLLVMVPPKLSISDCVGIVKGRSAIRVPSQFTEPRRKPCWGHSFLDRGILRRHSRIGSDNGPGMRQVSEKKGQEIEQRQLRL